MKNSLLILMAAFMFIVSCSSESNENDMKDEETILLKKIISSTFGTTEYTYIDDKIHRVKNPNGSYSEYTYTEDLITNRQGFNGNGQPDGSMEFYEYENGKLVNRKIYSNSDLVDEVSIVPVDSRTLKIVGENEQNYTLLHLDSSGNIYKEERFNDNQVTSTTIKGFDNNNSPFKNIRGANEIVLYAPVFNNVLSIEVNNRTERTNEYQYNSNGYPTSMERFDSEGNSTGTATFYY